MARIVADWRPDIVVDRLQHRLDARPAASAGGLSEAAVRRRGAGDQAGRQGVALGADQRAGDAGDGRARLHAGARARARRRLRGDADRLRRARPDRRAVHARRAGRRRRGRPRDRGVLRREGRSPDGSRRARLHPFSAADRSPRAACAVAGRFRRSGSGNRATARFSARRVAGMRKRAGQGTSFSPAAGRRSRDCKRPCFGTVWSLPPRRRSAWRPPERAASDRFRMRSFNTAALLAREARRSLCRKGQRPCAQRSVSPFVSSITASRTS